MAAKKTQEKTYRPSDLAEELNVDAKRIRAFLRGNEDTMRPLEAKNTSWTLTEAQADLIRERFTKDESDDED